MKPASPSDYRAAAQRRLPRFLFEYIDGGSYDESTLRANVEDLRAIALRQRVLRDVGTLDLSVELFGRTVAMPVALGPVGLAGLNARRGEVQAARAAATANVPFCLSTVSACTIGEVRTGSPAPFWFQLYMIRDRGFMQALLDQARDTGCTALLFTVDMPLPGTRYRDHRSGLAGAPGWRGGARRTLQALARPAWAWDVGIRGRPHSLGNVAPVLREGSGLEDFLGWMRANFDPTVTWKDVEFIRERWNGPLVIKGVLDVEDAVSAADLGADGLIVSNHGGRQLDGVSSTAKALPAIAEAVGDRLTVLADGGVRSGLDVVRMLALGARGVMLGRLWAYALAAGGEAAVRRMLQLIRDEIHVAMSLTGNQRASTITRESLLARQS